jgi:decaprenylphospho-beta-D-erythro-pentofuranosid-2-ulose 2-reductase
VRQLRERWARPGSRPGPDPGDADGDPGYQPRVLLLGGTSEIGLAIVAALQLPAAAEVILAGRDEQRMTAAARPLPCRVRTLPYDAVAVDTHQAVVDEAFASGPVDLVIAAAGVLAAQDTLDHDPLGAGRLVETNFTGHVTTLLAATARLRAQGHGTIVVLSSVAAIRPRRFNYVYGAAKAGLDAFARGLADSLHGTGVRVLLVRPGFVTGRMTRGMPPAPLPTTPGAVGSAVASALAGRAAVVWVPPQLGVLAVMLRLVPRRLWRRLHR